MANEDYKNVFDPEKCTVGIKTSAALENTENRLSQMIERLDERMSDMKEDLGKLSQNMDTKFAQVDSKLENMENKFEKQLNELKSDIPNIVDTRVQNKLTNKTANAAKWVVVSLCGGTLVTVFASFIKNLLGL